MNSPTTKWGANGPFCAHRAPLLIGGSGRPVAWSAVIEIYTDGACRGNPGPGGWAWAVAPDGTPRGSGGEAHTTNQRMEIMAVLEALRSLPGEVTIVSDSTYVVNCFRDGWWEKWLRNGWKNAKREPVANVDLWKPLVELYQQRRPKFRWVKGHGGHALNDLVDELAVAAALDPSSHAPARPADTDAAHPTLFD